MRTAIVTTTINIPKLLAAYTENARRHGHRDVRFIVVGDKKTPPAAALFCGKLSRKTGFEIAFLDIPLQLRYLRRYPELRAHLPFHSIQRRNIGILFAYEEGATKEIITIDDDNFVMPGDFVGSHRIVGTEAELDVFSSSSGWLNVCAFLAEKRGFPFYHRGFPLGKRWVPERLVCKRETHKIVVNAGFWLGDPDIDAITRLALPVEATAFTRKRNVALTPGTWSPFNSQNTALAREVIPAYFLSPRVGRYDDIWASYVVVKIAHHLGHAIAFGYPLVRQERNPHNYFKDFEKERQGMELSDFFCGLLGEIRLRGRSYAACYREVRMGLERRIAQAQGIAGENRIYLKGYLEGMTVWEKTIARAESVTARRTR